MTRTTQSGYEVKITGFIDVDMDDPASPAAALGALDRLRVVLEESKIGPFEIATKYRHRRAIETPAAGGGA